MMQRRLTSRRVLLAWTTAVLLGTAACAGPPLTAATPQPQPTTGLTSEPRSAPPTVPASLPPQTSSSLATQPPGAQPTVAPSVATPQLPPTPALVTAPSTAKPVAPSAATPGNAQPTALTAPPSGSSTGGMSLTLVAQAGAARAPRVFDLQVLVPPGSRLGAWIVDLSFDPAQLRATACDGDVSTCNPDYRSDAVRVVGASMSGLTGTPVLASIQFDRNQATLTSATFKITPVELTDAEGAPISPYPAPTSLQVNFSAP